MSRPSTRVGVAKLPPLSPNAERLAEEMFAELAEVVATRDLTRTWLRSYLSARSFGRWTGEEIERFVSGLVLPGDRQ